MAYALETRREETPAPAEGWSDLWMLPILLLALIFETFRTHLTKLKQMRRSRPMPKNWRSFYPDLRKCEWAIHCFCLEGARQIILGEDLDLSALGLDPEPTDGFQPSMPRSAKAMHLRLQDIARFHADPERWIRRHAERIRARSGDDDDFLIPNPNPANPTTTIFSNPDVRIAIRGPPPAQPRLPIADCRLPRRASENAKLRPKAHSNRFFTKQTFRSCNPGLNSTPRFA